MDPQSDINKSSEPHEPRRRALRDKRRVLTSQGQVSIRSLFWLTLLCVFCVLLVNELYYRAGAIAAAAAMLAILSVLAHLAGAAIGSRFGDDAPSVEPSIQQQTKAGQSDLPQSANHDEDTEPEIVHLQPMQARKTDFAPTTELSRQQPLNRRPIFLAVGIGSFVCSVLAAIILTIVMWDDLAIVNVLFGAFSAAVIGGLLGFWLSSFFQVVRSAVSDAQKEN